MICVIIPTLNAERPLARLLPEVCQADRTVVSDGGSDDRTLSTAIDRNARLAVGTQGRGPQLARGAHWAGDCEWLLFLHADVSPPINWKQIADEHIRQHPDKAGYFRFRFDSDRIGAKIVNGLVSLRCKFWALPYGDQGLLISRQLYEDIGGFADMPLFEDVDIIRRLGRRRLRALPGHIRISAQKYERDGYFRRGFRNLRLLRRYTKGTAPESLARDYA